MRSISSSFYASILLGCLCTFQAAANGSHNEPGHPRDLQVVLELGRQNAEHQECVDNMYLSDVNGDFLLSEDEYTLFIARQSEGRVLAENYADLPFSLITHFVYGACFCSIIFQTPNCCVGSEAMIDLHPDVSPFIEANLVTICVSVDDAIDDSVGPQPPAPAPTAPPVPAPTNPPTVSATEAPSPVPSAAPSPLPVADPTIAPTPLVTNATSSSSPTIVLSSAPTVIALPTAMPTPEGLSCVTFQYGIGNSDGFTADDIFNEVDNTLKTGLLLATRNVTIATLNATFPRDGRRLKRDHDNKKQGPLASSPYNLYIADLEQFQSIGSGKTRWFEARFLANANGRHDTHGRRAAYLPSLLDHSVMGDRRRLVFYSDDFMPVINAMFINPICEDLPEFECSVVDSTVCVLLEEGDNEQEVQTALLAGIEQSIVDGSFQAAIPPEHQLPGGVN